MQGTPYYKLRCLLSYDQGPLCPHLQRLAARQTHRLTGCKQVGLALPPLLQPPPLAPPRLHMQALAATLIVTLSLGLGARWPVRLALRLPTPTALQWQGWRQAVLALLLQSLLLQ